MKKIIKAQNGLRNRLKRVQSNTDSWGSPKIEYYNKPGLEGDGDIYGITLGPELTYFDRQLSGKNLRQNRNLYKTADEYWNYLNSDEGKASDDYKLWGNALRYIQDGNDENGISYRRKAFDEILNKFRVGQTFNRRSFNNLATLLNNLNEIGNVKSKTRAAFDYAFDKQFSEQDRQKADELISKFIPNARLTNGKSLSEIQTDDYGYQLSDNEKQQIDNQLNNNLVTPMYNRSQTRQWLRDNNINPYKYTGAQRRALRRVLNGIGNNNDIAITHNMGIPDIMINPNTTTSPVDTPIQSQSNPYDIYTNVTAYVKNGTKLIPRNVVKRFKQNRNNF